MRKNNHGNSGLLSQYERHAPWALITCIFLAQFFATGGLITKSRLLFAIEETLWGAGFFSVLPLAIIQFRRAFPGRTEIKTTGTGHAQNVQCGECRLVLDLLYLCTHIPLANGILGNRPRATGNRNSPNQDRHQCSIDAFYIVNVSHSYADWGFGFVLWHSAYFSVCVWLALFLMRAPRYRQFNPD